MAERREDKDPLDFNNPEAQYEIPADGVVQEYYIDSMNFQTQLYTSILFLGEMQSSPEQKPILRLKVKVSPQMLKAMALLLNKQMKEYEEHVGPIALPKQVLHQWGLEEEL